jgi:hypothetical protein
MIKRIAILIISIQLLAACAMAADKASCRMIAFTTEFEGELQLLNCSSGEIRRLNVGWVAAGDLAYSGAGDLLAFDEGEGPGRSGSLYLLHLKTLKVERIYKEVRAKHSLYRPQFDPEGSYLYAVNYFAGIYRYCLASRAWKKIRISGIDALKPQGLSFSKSGRKVAISAGDFKGFYIAGVANGAFDVQGRVATDFLSCISPQWIGDEEIVFAGRKEAGLQHIWKLDFSSGRLDQITGLHIGTRDFLSLSRDEKTIVFTGTSLDEKLELGIWKISIDGTGLKQLTHRGPLSGSLSPVWIE